MKFRGFIFACAFALIAMAFGGVAVFAEGPYAGVAPNNENPPPGAARAKRAKVLTWPGFEMLEDGSSRFFFQTSKRVTWTKRTMAQRFELILKNTSVHLSNTLRPLETQYFSTPVKRAWVRRSGRNAKVIFELRNSKKPKVSQITRPDGFHFVFVEFPALASAAD